MWGIGSSSHRAIGSSGKNRNEASYPNSALNGTVSTGCGETPFALQKISRSPDGPITRCQYPPFLSTRARNRWPLRYRLKFSENNV